MSEFKKAVYYISTNEGRPGTVSRVVWEILNEKGLLRTAGMSFDNREVMMHRDGAGNEYYFAQSEVPVCWDYPRYLAEMNGKFADADFSGIVTWHEGASATPKVLTVHTIGDVNAGVYGPANPAYMRNILLSMEHNRVMLGLSDYMTVTEATHWSGTAVSGSSPELILQYPVPMVDIEVGSEEDSWNNRTACEALADALTHVFESDGKRVHNLLCAGGVHFDPNFAQAVFTQWKDDAFGVSHIIANQWLVAGEYEKEHGLEFISAAIDKIAGGVEAVVFHDKMKGCYKDLVRAVGEKYQIPVLRHQRLRQPEELQL